MLIEHKLIRPTRLSYADALELAREDGTIHVVQDGPRISVTHSPTGRVATMHRLKGAVHWRCEVVGRDGRVHFCHMSKGHTLTFAVRYVKGQTYHC